MAADDFVPGVYGRNYCWAICCPYSPGFREIFPQFLVLCRYDRLPDSHCVDVLYSDSRRAKEEGIGDPTGGWSGDRQFLAKDSVYEVIMTR
jgi:hypothetical protein